MNYENVDWINLFVFSRNIRPKSAFFVEKYPFTIVPYMLLNKYNNLIYDHLSRITVDENLGHDSAKKRYHCPE